MTTRRRRRWPRSWPRSRAVTPISAPPWTSTSSWSPTGSSTPPSCRPARRLLVGAYFTQEYAVESAALCNPSIVPHPDQSDLGPGDARFVMSLRAVGEGHRSSIEFRTGVIDSGAELRFDVPGSAPVDRAPGPTRHRRDLFHRVLRSLGDDGIERGVRARFVAGPVLGRRARAGLGGAARAAGHPPRCDRDDRSHPLGRRPPTTRSRSRPLRPSPSGSCRPWRRSRATGWRTPASSGSSTTTASPPTSRPTPRTTGPTSDRSS